MNYSIILFDIDGVMITEQYQFSNGLKRDYGIELEKMLPFFNGNFRDCGIGKRDLKEELAKVIQDWGWKGTVDELVEYWLTTGTGLDPNMIQFVKSLREQGTRVYSLTDQEKYRGEHLRKVLKRDVFEEVFFSAELGMRKKEIGTFEFTYRAIGEPEKGSVLFVDDTQANLDTAKEFGIDTHLFKNLETLKEFLG